MEPNYRRCLGCGKIAHKSEFWRVVRTHPSHAIELDHGFGRSTYLCPQPTCLQLVQKKNKLSRALKAAVPKQIYEHLWQQLTPDSLSSNL
ncbi:YlxR family protein [Leptolyngbya sp. FACHB-36]|uniref:YlxR family protein n=1 Tax=Leptolyngbya sp. FACHB-36 TaxID=2692808 RepID=UPI00168146A0|nr:YlxR family protein [Leptolyngbya sp. FACHB-36]MBD2019618.1 YlxR family protein [Leptolyngbya sp. FACHB-36]